MSNNFSRRALIKTAGIAAIAAAPEGHAAAAASAPQLEGKDTPKICLEAGVGGLAAGTIDEAGLRKIKQLGVDHVLTGAPRIPWGESRLQEMMDRLKAGGLSLGKLIVSGFPDTIYGGPGGGAGLTAFDNDRVKDLPPLPEEGAHNSEEIWANITYFLKAVIPVAEQSGVRLALHPNDPPAPLSRGSGQIMGTVEGWKRLIEIVKSPANGITFDCGVTKEMGHDPVEVCHYFGSRDRINQVHYRNVRVRKPYEKYTEVFIDEGENNMFAIMKELVKQKYPRLVYPEHPRAIDYDRDRPGFRSQYPGGGGYAAFAYNVGYARAMMQAALSS